MTYASIKSWLVAHPRSSVAAVGVLLFVCGGACGRFVHPRLLTVTKTEVQTKTVVQYQDRIVYKEAEVVYKDRVVTRYVFTPGGQVASETIEHDATSDKKDTTKNEVASGGSTTTTDSKTSVTVSPLPDPRFVASAGVGMQPFRGGGFVGMVALDARVVGPLYLGAWATVPTTDLAGTAIGLSAGVRF